MLHSDVIPVVFNETMRWWLAVTHPTSHRKPSKRSTSAALHPQNDDANTAQAGKDRPQRVALLFALISSRYERAALVVNGKQS